MTASNWVLAVLTGVLAIATIFYCAYASWKMYKGSVDQGNAMNELTRATVQLPRIQKHITEENKFRQQKQEEQRKKQEKALKCYSNVVN